MFQTSRTSTTSQHPIFNPPGSHLEGNICEDPKPSFVRNCSSIQVFQDPQVPQKNAGTLFVHSPYGEIHQTTREMDTPNFPSLGIDGATTPPLLHPYLATQPITTTRPAFSTGASAPRIPSGEPSFDFKESRPQAQGPPPSYMAGAAHSEAKVRHAPSIPKEFTEKSSQGVTYQPSNSIPLDLPSSMPNPPCPGYRRQEPQDHSGPTGRVRIQRRG